jgi:type VI protein secretion system component Hcp
MNGKGLLAALFLVPCLSFAAAAQGQQVGLVQGAVMVENFDQPSPQGWELLPGAQVQAVDRGSALVCDDGGHGVWIAARARDLTLQFRYRPGQGVGRVAVSASGEPPNAQEYSIVLAPGEIGVDRVASGQVKNLAGGTVMLRPNSWYEMTVQVQGGRISVSVGGQTVVTAVDRQPLPAGTIAFGALEGSGFAFDNVALMPAGGAEQQAAMMVQRAQVAEVPSVAQQGRLQTVGPKPAAPSAAMPSPSMSSSGQMLAGSALPYGAVVYLFIDGIHQGTKKGVQNWTQVESFEFSIGSSTSAQDWTRARQPQSTSKTAFGPLMVTKQVDMISPVVYLHSVKGTPLTQANIKVVDSTGTVHMRINLWDVRIGGVETEGSSGGNVFDTISLSFSKVKWEVRTGPKSSVHYGWDLKKNDQF